MIKICPEGVAVVTEPLEMSRIGGCAKIGLACPVQLGGGPSQKVNNKGGRAFLHHQLRLSRPITANGISPFVLSGKVIGHIASFIEKYIRNRATASHRLRTLERRAAGVFQVVNSSTFDAIDHARQRSDQQGLSTKSTERLRTLIWPEIARKIHIVRTALGTATGNERLMRQNYE